MKINRIVIGGFLAFALLTLFVFAVIFSIIIAYNCPSTQTCNLNDGTAQVLQMVGALISAVVISELSVMPPAQAPGTRIAEVFPQAGIFAFVYIGVWLLSGFALVIVGWVLYPEVAELNSAAKQWLGVAIGAAYAYFGISPP